MGGAAFPGGLREAARTARSEVPPTGAAPETLDAPREPAEGLARAYRDHGDTMRRDTIRIADEAGLPYSALDRIIEAWEARANARYKT